MRKPALAAAVVVLGCLLGVIAWLNLRHNARRPVTAPVPVVRNNEVQLDERQLPPGVPDPLRAALDRLAAGEPGAAHALPSGTRILSLNVKTGLAIVDFSQEFLRLSTSGDTSESVAQRALLSALAQFSKVDRVTVMVEGKVFSGEHSGDWVDLPVRGGPGL